MNWQEQALDARHTPPDWAQALLGRMGVPLSGQWHMVSVWCWRYSLDGLVFNVRKLSENPHSLFGPWATLEHVCLTCGKTATSTGIHDPAELGAVLTAWPAACSCQKGV